MAADKDTVNHLPELAKGLDKAIGMLLEELAKAIAEEAMHNAPVNTGFLESSIYYVTDTKSTYGNASTPPGDAKLLPEIPKPKKPTEAYVAVAASYAPYVEYGSAHGPSQPYLTPAKDTVEGDLSHYASHLEGYLAKMI